MLPEHGMGVGVAALGDGGEHGVVDGGAASGIRSVIAASHHVEDVRGLVNASRRT